MTTEIENVTLPGMPADEAEPLWAVRYADGTLIPMPDRASAEVSEGLCDELDRRYVADGQQPRFGAGVLAWPGTAEEHAIVMEQLEAEA